MNICIIWLFGTDHQGLFFIKQSSSWPVLTKLVVSVFDLANYNAFILLNVTSVKNASVKT